jgi:antitoxin component YwqK of YwqJK toxin-antitoxin module
MKKIILIAVLFFSLISFGQTPINKVIFYDSIRKETFSKDYYFKEIIKEYNLEKDAYEVEYFQKSQNIDVKISNYFINDKNKLTLHGKYTYYYPSGSIKKIDNYENGIILGITKKWYEDGKLCFEGEYKFINGEKLLFHYNYFDKNGVQKLKDGFGIFEEFYEENIQKSFIGNIKNGLKDGLWKSTNLNFPKNEVIYENGIFVKGKIIKSENLAREYFKDPVNANPEGGMQEFRNIIAKNVQKSSSNIKYKGKFNIKFVVDENGELINFKSNENLNDELFKNLIEIIKSSGKWESAIYNGKEVKQYFALPIIIN